MVTAPFLGFLVGSLQVHSNCLSYSDIYQLPSRLFGASVLQAYQYYLNYAHDLRSRKFIVLKLSLSVGPYYADYRRDLRLRRSCKLVFGVPMFKRSDPFIIIRCQYIRLGAFLLFCKYGLQIPGECPFKPRSGPVWHFLTLMFPHQLHPGYLSLRLEFRSLKVSEILANLSNEKCGFDRIL